MATYLAHDALRLRAASLLANSGLCVNIEIKIWLLLGVNVDTANTLKTQITKSRSTLSMRLRVWCLVIKSKDSAVFSSAGSVVGPSCL